MTDISPSMLKELEALASEQASFAKFIALDASSWAALHGVEQAGGKLSITAQFQGREPVLLAEVIITEATSITHSNTTAEPARKLFGVWSAPSVFVQSENETSSAQPPPTETKNHGGHFSLPKARSLGSFSWLEDVKTLKKGGKIGKTIEEATLNSIANQIESAVNDADDKQGFAQKLLAKLKELGIDVVTLSTQTQRQSRASKAHLSFEEAASMLVPSELWADRKTGRAENPAAFIRRVYVKEIANGSLTKPDLLKADKRLYQAYATWISRHPEDDVGLSNPRRQTFETAEATLAHKRALGRAAWHRLQGKAKL